MPKQVMVRYRNLHGNSSTLKRCEVLSEANGKMRVKCSDERNPREVAASDTVPIQSVYGQANPGTNPSQVKKAYPESKHCLANQFGALLAKK